MSGIFFVAVITALKKPLLLKKKGSSLRRSDRINRSDEAGYKGITCVQVYVKAYLICNFFVDNIFLVSCCFFTSFYDIV